jgi:hypothetical protein
MDGGALNLLQSRAVRGSAAALLGVCLVLLCLSARGARAAGSEPLAPTAGAPSLLAGRSMWIWYLDRSDGGKVRAIAAQAHAADVQTLFVKSADGDNYWSQFSRTLVSRVHAAGLHICAWQYIYGTDPVGEAAQAVHAVHDGADCLIIDAEREYQGRYAAAQTYINDLRAAVGSDFPIGLASFPYVDYHPAFPYSVFLGPGGAQFDLPQMYWGDIGGSLEALFAHTYADNRIYGRPVYPVGQTYGSPTAFDIGAFRALTEAYGAPGLSWWDLAWTSANGLWSNLSALLTPIVGFTGPRVAAPTLAEGDRGDDVLWMQEHLARALPDQLITGLYGAQTRADVKALQARDRLTVTGNVNWPTWNALLELSPVAVQWGAPAESASTRRPAAADMRSSGPASASTPALGYEIPELGSAHSAEPEAGAHGSR